MYSHSSLAIAAGGTVGTLAYTGVSIAYLLLAAFALLALAMAIYRVMPRLRTAEAAPQTGPVVPVRRRR